ncbi:catalytic phage domain protein : Site-specific recombinase XerD OS=Singulisphaera acidiphila (strain ATCC BAA-1392 / DSM 18658 / VKM B-2454 / MOB10) GN=Sinac_1635 PE=4 SV=1: Phage_integrase [Gemmataceae bacterium]|nr:catalytic phage domain protein : Site-specific recombinase XerD OS=Singulisphaera acidiphila (strain ATCC BAA-1392 / DSM 18658 / VKM B-2454 / MOB10) GN=Sinac_1635 PE=4 SV=1: Phage_integrase [Gemmataceae bacterium]VTT98862.1 catalytic phage domain protein : Site-specific recombinase XerD OS=Singulisphaera acidiphila (strain ATCC BAA-1392 / DSM 18658 / VKM B-2454 / MOB10) GN=Sinac_1635 PE=4 SV=1: Phage_integrase [Gemmataceae bacterium]
MPPQRTAVPSYRLHKQSGQALVTIRTPDGGRRDVLLGKYNSPESRVEYARVIAALSAPAPVESGPAAPPCPGGGLTVNELALAFMRHAADYYRHPDGGPTSAVGNFKSAIRPLCAECGPRPAAEFGPIALKAVRQRMIAAGWCRSGVNTAVERVKRVFKWGVGEELVPPHVYEALRAVPGLKKGRTAAPERPPVPPVDDAAVAATLPHLTRHVRGLVEFQRLTGCRPGEACALRRCDVDTSGAVWLYTPPHHKTAYRGKARVIPIGPRAQALLAEFPTDAPADHVFSPRRSAAEVRADRAAARKTPQYPSERRAKMKRKKAAPEREPGDAYTPSIYACAIGRAVEKANAEDRRNPDLGPALPPVPEWAPNQLRHSFATAVRAAHGIEAVQVLLGHANLKTSEIYAEKNTAAAVAIAAQVG